MIPRVPGSAISNHIRTSFSLIRGFLHTCARFHDAINLVNMCSLFFAPLFTPAIARFSSTPYAVDARKKYILFNCPIIYLTQITRIKINDEDGSQLNVLTTPSLRLYGDWFGIQPRSSTTAGYIFIGRVD